MEISMNYKHNGVEIDFDEKSAKFVASINGQTVKKDSLAAIRTAIDRAKTFSEFPIIMLDSGRHRGDLGPIVEDVVIGTKKTTYGLRWLTKRGIQAQSPQYCPDTPENRKALLKLHDANETYTTKRRELDAAHKVQCEAIRNAITQLRNPS